MIAQKMYVCIWTHVSICYSTNLKILQRYYKLFDKLYLILSSEVLLNKCSISFSDKKIIIN